MEYTVQKLGKMAGVSTRTLRYYDEMEFSSRRGSVHPGTVSMERKKWISCSRSFSIGNWV